MMPSLMGLARLTRLVYHENDIQGLNDGLLQRLDTDSDDADAWMDLSILAYLRFQSDLAYKARAVALSIRRLYTLPPDRPSRLTLLALMTPGDLMANTPLEFLLEDSDITLLLLYIETVEDLSREVPQHDVLFVAIGESDQNMPLLQSLISPLRAWSRPVINRPEYIMATGRDRAFNLLADIPGLAMLPTARVDRSSLAVFLHEFGQTAIVRPVDSHAGRGLARLETIDEAVTYLVESNEDLFYVSPYIDYAGSDGLFRKYRVVLLAGQAYAGHLAVSEHWMVHYLNAGMTESAGKRAEEAGFMARFDEDFAQRHRVALGEIVVRTGLDYVVLDCAELPDGTLLIFEIDTSAVLHDMDADEHFAYKRHPMQKLFTAFRAFLTEAAEQI